MIIARFENIGVDIEHSQKMVLNWELAYFHDEVVNFDESAVSRRRSRDDGLHKHSADFFWKANNNLEKFPNKRWNIEISERIFPCLDFQSYNKEKYRRKIGG